VFTLAGGAIAYKTKKQTITATSSTKAELIAAVLAAKSAKYFRTILHELGYTQTGPTVLYEDNESTIKIVNNERPTTRTRHMDISWFAIQEWHRNGDISLVHIPGVINPSDAQTKPLAFVLHHRHCRRAMGHFGNPVTNIQSIHFW
jgi:hypothetical protein